MAERRDPLDRLLDLALAIPTCTAVATRRAIPLAAKIGIAGAAKLVERVSAAVHEQREPVVDELPTGTPVVAVPAEVVETEADEEPPESVSSDELPIEGYDDLAARQVVDRLPALDRADLARIEIYEREHRNRSTILGKISMLTTA